MTTADWSLLAVAAAGQALRALGLLLAGPLRPDHPFIRWATAVARATLAAFVVQAVISPAGVLAAVPLVARLAGAVAAGGWLLWRDAVLGGLLVGLGATLAVWWAISLAF